MNKISGVYKITNTVTGEFYIGSSKDVETRWVKHKSPSRWKAKPNNKMYQDMQKYGVDKFRFQILVPVMEEHLKQVEQEFIETLKPTYNSKRAKGIDIERCKERQKEYQKKYQQSEKVKEVNKKAHKKYDNQLCVYNGETLTLEALRKRFQRAGIPHQIIEAKKYLCQVEKQ